MLDKNLRGNEMDNVKNQSNDHIEYLDSCPGCKSDAITVLKKPYERKVQVTEGDDMSVTTGVSGCESCGLTFLNPRMGQKTLQKKASALDRVNVRRLMIKLKKFIASSSTQRPSKQELFP